MKNLILICSIFFITNAFSQWTYETIESVKGGTCVLAFTENDNQYPFLKLENHKGIAFYIGEFINAYGEQPLGKFIRNILGLEVSAAKSAFSKILVNQTLNAQQIRFVDMIINFLTVKGIIEPSMLFDAPFTDINTSGIMGVFDTEISQKIIELIEEINHTAEVA